MTAFQQFDVGATIAAKLTKPDGSALPLPGLEIRLLMRKPSGRRTVRTMIAGADPGVVEYVTETGDLDEAGRWRFQVRVTGSGVDLRSRVGTFDVLENVDRAALFLTMEPAAAFAENRQTGLVSS